ncbi:hypothetical protein FBEOM_569 [Fusarium beomiforme]|uniref:Uncharacterized protein n=1 Tax=Fusarium beomiforme TaxID=44412 RepID=A0A9P5E4W9_9HYPO|nr:hypothetical protein FBEOM_569 [Fusarium beomiforme]
MREPRTENQWRDSPEATQLHHKKDIKITASRTSTTTIMSLKSASSARQPLSPPNSPPASSSISSSASEFKCIQPLQPQSIDVLASRLGSSTLEHFRCDSSRSTTRLPETGLSPISLPDDDCVNVQSMIGYRGLNSMEIDPYHEVKAAKSHSLSSTKAQDDRACALSGPLNSFLPIAVDPTALAEASGDSSRSVYRSTTTGGFEVDEGYCEDEPDFSCLQPLVPRRTTGTPDGIKKRYELGYRRSADAASRCRNTIHSVPRMRRRDKKRNRQSQPHSTANSVRGRSDSQVPQMVISTQ